MKKRSNKKRKDKEEYKNIFTDLRMNLILKILKKRFNILDKIIREEK